MSTKDTSDSGLPVPEVLKSQFNDDNAVTSKKKTTDVVRRSINKVGGIKYRPSHKATFIGVGVVLLILGVNAAIVSYFLQSKAADTGTVNRSDVTISPEVLNGLGVSRNTVGSQNTELTVGPNAKFNGTLTVADDVSIAGKLSLNSKFSASDASLTKLQAGDTTLNKLDVNGDINADSLSLRKDLNVDGSIRFQGAVTVNQLLTVANNLNVTGNLSIGGVLTSRSLQVNTLVVDAALSVGGHIVTGGAAPGVGSGSAVGSNGTVSISGNDTAGTVAVNVGAGAVGGIVAQIAFRQQYSNTPHVVVTPVGPGVSSFYVSRSVGGFNIGVNNALSPGGYAFDYIVVQ